MFIFVFPSGDFQTVSTDFIPTPAGAEKHEIPDNGPIDQAAWNGSALVDRSTITTWYVDVSGNKFSLKGDPSWQAVQCHWSDVLAKTGSTWGIKAPVASTIFAPRDFIALFTTDEQTALFTARRTSVQVDQFITLAMAGPVDVSNAEVIADIGTVQAAGLLTADRAAQILAGTAALTE